MRSHLMRQTRQLVSVKVLEAVRPGGLLAGPARGGAAVGGAMAGQLALMGLEDIKLSRKRARCRPWRFLSPSSQKAGQIPCLREAGLAPKRMRASANVIWQRRA